MDFIKGRKIFYFFSLSLIAIGLLALIFWSLKPGVDFAGGSLLEFKVSKKIEEKEIKSTLKPLNLGILELIPETGNSYQLRTKFVEEKTHQEILTLLKKKYPSLEEKKFETIGPSIGRELKHKGIFAGILALIGIALYVGLAFSKVSRPISSWKYGIITIITLFHDAFITLGLYTLYAHFFGGYIDSPLLVALLTIIGYSVNDTIVVFDRTRENLRRKLGQMPFPEIVNTSIKETLNRSINTSLTTCLPLLALLLIGPKSLFSFALVILIGILIGTYSSICIASPLLVDWSRKK